MKIIPLCLLPLAATVSLLSASANDTWTLSDGRRFEGQVKLVTPGAVIFSRANSPDVPLETTKLSAESRLQLIRVLGLQPQPETSQTKASPVAPGAVATASMPLITRNAGAIDATDVNLIDSRFGLPTVIVGKVKEVITLGSTGHKRLNFENTTFHVFIPKRSLEKSDAWKLDALAGKTVQVTGEISRYQEQLQIQLTDPLQIGLIE